jgi:hypothetical protein
VEPEACEMLARIALDLGRCREWFTLGLADVEDVDATEAQDGLRGLSSRCSSSFGRIDIGAMITMPFSPFLTKRFICFQVVNPATWVASGFCMAMSRTFPNE